MTATHGTRSRYNHQRCHCAACTDANNAYQSAYNQTGPRTVPADTARTVIRGLLEAGETCASIAARTGHSPALVGRIARGKVARLKAATHRDFLALTAPTPA